MLHQAFIYFSSVAVWRRLLLMLWAVVMGMGGASAAEPAWQKVAYRVPVAESPLTHLAQKHEKLFTFFVENALHGKGKKDFETVTKRVKNKIMWRNGSGTNIYHDAFVRSYPFVSKVDLQGMPDSILLIAYLESQWHGKKGKKSADYGYWQFTPEVLKEIQSLDYVPDGLKTTNINKLRADATLSTQAAQVHLHRYHFYFANVAKFSESDAWLLTFTAFNWGAGNVKRMIADMESEGIEANFANFYHRLYAAHKANPSDISLRAATEYVPSLWNIAQLIGADK
ncbi:transglycosylase SLT domain-containing protein [Thiothrix lacustris]|uniref:transglycosylase SLT domain-containing protein n=1 Tax=Thiothrix lacustris TaxID=525917 RepID=UPI0027E3F116|nr:transglycosylase SLT domain-containing protein [Thiothrix lacustris]WMP16126.1 transglycosylase SLT domain-containing protein [Thiothrix lacustris]